MKKNKKLTIYVFIVLITILFISCADNETVNCLIGHKYGFWGGLWHGIIAPFDFIGMLIWDDISVYAPNNNGTWYAFGFLLGSGGIGFTLGRKE